jgi:hypothetical protein
MKQQLLGSLSPSEFLAAIFFALVGLVISLLLQSNVRDVKSDNTPFHFDWGFLLLDNWKRIVLSILMIYISIRFYADIFGQPITMFLALGIGFGLDKISQLIKDKIGITQVDREAIK